MYLVGARSNKGVISQVTTYICSDHFTIDAIAGNEILVLSRIRRGLGRRHLLRRGGSSSHGEGVSERVRDGAKKEEGKVRTEKKEGKGRKYSMG